MLATKPMPAELKRRVEAALAAGEHLKIELDSDLTTDLKFGESWLVVTDRRVLVWTQPAGDTGRRNGHPLTDVPLKGLESAEILPVVGGGVLVLKLKKERKPVLHYSNTLSARFAEAAKGITQLAKSKPLELSTDLKSDRCPKCGRLLPDPNERCPFCVKILQAMGRILLYLKPYTWYTIWTVLVTAAGTILMLIPPQITKTIIDKAIPGHDVTLLGWMVMAFLGINFAHTLIQMYNGRQLSWLGGRVGTDIRAHVFQSVERLGMKFFDRRAVGQIMARVMNDSGQLQNFLIDGFPYLAQNALLLGGIIVILMKQSVLLTLLIMIPVPVMFIGQYLFWKFVRAMSHKAWNQYALLNNRLHESVSGVRVVKAFSQEGRELERFNSQNNKWFQTQFKVDSFWGVFHPGMHFFVSSGVLIVWWVGGQWLIKDEMTIGELMAYINYLWMFYGPLQWFSQVNNWMTRAFAGAERIFETIDTTPESYDSPDAKSLPKFRGDIEFRDVTFSYEKGKPALKEVSFKVKAGEMIGLVGKSGSGKSTMLSMLSRFYLPDEGEILIDGIPIQNVKLQDLRRHIGLVLQEPFLFGSSIYDNISYSRPDATFDQVVEAARAGNAHDFIMGKNDAYDTRVGERGNRLSGGEKQRVSIARANLHNPRLLILDEATSSVDTETEAKIQEAMDRLVRNRTTFVAAHRLSTLRAADRIFVMDEGKLAEAGTHEALIAKKGIYYRLVKAQEQAWRKSRRHMSIAH